MSNYQIYCWQLRVIFADLQVFTKAFEKNLNRLTIDFFGALPID